MKFELELIKWLQSFRNALLDNVFQGFTIFGEETVLILVLGFVYWCYNKKLGERLGLTLFLSLTFNSLVKAIFMRPRPYVVDDSITPIRISTAGGYSFPSGHTQSAATLFFGLYYFIKKKWLLVVAIVITVLVAISRMYLGVHYLTDVLAGGLFGILFAYGAGKFLTDKVNYNKIYFYILNFVALAFVVVLIINLVQSTSDLDQFVAHEFYNKSETMSKMVGTIFGFMLGIMFEKSKVDFTNHNNIKKNILRFLLGIGIILMCRYLLKYLFTLIIDPTTLTAEQVLEAIMALLLDFIRYFTMVFIGIGVYPLLFKKLHI